MVERAGRASTAGNGARSSISLSALFNATVPRYFLSAILRVASQNGERLWGKGVRASSFALVDPCEM